MMHKLLSTALLALAAKAGLTPEAAQERWPRIAEIPFDSATKYMATFHHAGEHVLLCVKGAPDVLFARATRHLGERQKALAFDAAARSAFGAENEAIADQALRVLALASREIPAAAFDPAGDLLDWVEDLTLHALVGIMTRRVPRRPRRSRPATPQASG